MAFCQIDANRKSFDAETEYGDALKTQYQRERIQNFFTWDMRRTENSFYEMQLSKCSKFKFVLPIDDAKIAKKIISNLEKVVALKKHDKVIQNIQI